MTAKGGSDKAFPSEQGSRIPRLHQVPTGHEQLDLDWRTTALDKAKILSIAENGYSRVRSTECPGNPAILTGLVITHWPYRSVPSRKMGHIISHAGPGEDD